MLINTSSGDFDFIFCKKIYIKI